MKGLLLNPPALIVGKNKEVRTNDGNFMLRDPVYSPFNLKVYLKSNLIFRIGCLFIVLQEKVTTMM